MKDTKINEKDEKPNAKCIKCEKLFYTPEANIWASEYDETFYCSEDCMKADGLSDEEIGDFDY